MEQDFSTRMINRTAARHIPAILEAYDRAGIDCGPASESILAPVVDKLKTLIATHQLPRLPQWAG